MNLFKKTNRTIFKVLCTFAFTFVFTTCSDELVFQADEQEPNLTIIYPTDGMNAHGNVNIQVQIVMPKGAISTRYQIFDLVDTTFNEVRKSFEFDFSSDVIYPDSSSYDLIVSAWSENAFESDTSRFMILRESLKKVTSKEEFEFFNVAPSWSLAPSRLIIQTGRTGNMEIYSISLIETFEGLPGGNPGIISSHNISNNFSAPDLTPSVWIDGQKIVFAKKTEDMYDLWIQDFNSTEPEPLTNHKGAVTWPSWFRDGSMIAYDYAERLDDQHDIYIVETETRTSYPLVEDESWDEHPSFSLSGDSIVFHSDRAGTFDLWVVQTSGGGQSILEGIEWNSDEKYPSWSPDGMLIAFTSDRSGNDDIWIYRLADKKTFQLTNNAAEDNFAVFSPHAPELAFASFRDYNWDIYIIDLPELR